MKNIWKKLWIAPVFMLALIAGLFLTTDRANASLDYGTPTSFATNTGSTYDICRLDDNHVAVAYKDHGGAGDGKIKIGTISGDGISWSADAQFSSSVVESVSIECLSSSKFVVAYDDQTIQLGYAKVGTVTAGWTVDGAGWGAATQFFEDDGAFYVNISALLSTKIVISYGYGSSEQYGTAIVGSIDGTGITFGGSNNYVTGSEYSDVAALSSDKFVIAYSDTNTQKATAIVGNVSGNEITSFGLPKIIDNQNASAWTSIVKLTSTSFAVTYQPYYGSINKGLAVVGSVLGTDTLNFGNPSIISNGTNGATEPSAGILNTNTIIASYADDDNSSYGTSKVGTISGNGIIWGNSEIFDSTSIDTVKVVNLGADKFVTIYRNQSTGLCYGAVGIYTTQTLNLGNIQTVVIDSVHNYIAALSVNSGTSIDIHWQGPGGVTPIPNVRTGTNLALMRGAGVVQDPLDSTRIYFGYTKTSSPTEAHVVHYDLDGEALISDTTVASNVNFNAAFARETYSDKPIIFYAIGSTGYIYRDSTSSAITNAAVYDAPLAVAYDGTTNIYVAYQDSSDLDLKTGSFAAAGSAAITPVTIEAMDAATIDIEAAGVRNSALEVVYQTNALAVKSATYNGSAYTATTLETLANTTDISAVELADDTKAVAVYYDGTSLVRQEITQATGASTKTVIQTGDIISPTVSLSSLDVETYTWGVEGTTTDDFFAMSEGETVPEQLNEQDEGPTVPELPTNIIWKVIIALMSMGAVITIAAVLRKRGVKSVKAKTKASGSKKAVKTVRTRKTRAKSRKK